MSARRVSIDRIKAVVAARFDVPIAKLVGQHRDLKFVRPRHIAVYLACEKSPLSRGAIGRLFGGRDPTTIYHAHWKTERQRSADRNFDQLIRSIEAEFEPEPAPQPEVQLSFLIGPLFDRDPHLPEPALRRLEAA